jgi:GT2 family glycosyltransferase
VAQALVLCGKQKNNLMKTHQLVSIITINYKQANVTNELLASLQKLEWTNVEIIVVDNAYDPLLEKESINQYSNVKIIRSRKNLGFAGGNNLGIRLAMGDYILLLNNDTVVKPDIIGHMVELLEKNPQIGAVSPLIKYFDNPSLIQYAGFTPMNKVSQRIKAIAHKQMDIGQYNRPTRTHFAHGCAMMVPRTTIGEVGLMKEDYFLYYEEHDWSQRIKDAGYDIYIQPKSQVLHKESVSTGKGSTLKTFFLNRNRIKFMQRHNKGNDKLLSYLYLSFISIPSNLLRYTLSGRLNHLRAYVSAIYCALTCNTSRQWNF